MKNLKFKIFSVFLLAFTLILNISCMNLVDFVGEDETYISISVGDGARMVMPSVSADSLTNIALYKTSVSEENKLSSWNNTSEIKNVKIPMEEGSCTLILKAKLGELELQDSKTITIETGANIVEFTLDASSLVIPQTIQSGDKGSVKNHTFLCGSRRSYTGYIQNL